MKFLLLPLEQHWQRSTLHLALAASEGFISHYAFYLGESTYIVAYSEDNAITPAVPIIIDVARRRWVVIGINEVVWLRDVLTRGVLKFCVVEIFVERNERNESVEK